MKKLEIFLNVNLEFLRKIRVFVEEHARCASDLFTVLYIKQNIF